MQSTTSSPLSAFDSPRQYQQTSPSKRYSHAGTPPYNRYSRSSINFDRPEFRLPPRTPRVNGSAPSSASGSAFSSHHQQVLSTQGDTLADELAQALNDDSAMGDELDFSSASQTYPPSLTSPGWQSSPSKRGKPRDSGVELEDSIKHTSGKDTFTTIGTQEPKAALPSPRKQRQPLEEAPNLDAYTADIAGLAAYQSTEEDNNIIPNFVNTLLALPTECTSETCGRNYVRTVSTSINTTSSSLHTLTTILSSTLLSPLSLSTDDIDILLHDLSTLAPLPEPTNSLSFACAHIDRTTTSLLDLFASISDTLHVSRETAATASRRLQTTRELATQARKELDQLEAAEKWLKDGEWERKLAKREAAKTCREIMMGFEGVCEGMKGRLIASSGQ